MGEQLNMLIYYCITGLILLFVSLPFLTALGSSCGATYVQCLPPIDQAIKNQQGSSYVAGTSEFQFGETILIGGLLFLWIVLPGLYVAIKYLQGGM